MLNILLVVYGDTYLDESIEKLTEISGKLFPHEKIRIVVADTALAASQDVKIYPGYVYIAPGNTNREFTGWRGCYDYVRKNYALTDDDVFIVANDTFFRNYGDEYLEDFLLFDVDSVKKCKKLIGYVDCYPSTVRYANNYFQCWVRTSFFITGNNVLIENDIFDPPFKKDDIFDEKTFLKDVNILSEKYKSYIKSWLFSDEDAPEEFPFKWHSAKPIKVSSTVNVIDKARCIVHEHSITWRLRSNGVNIVRVNRVEPLSDIDILPLELKLQTLFYLGRDNHEITNANIREYLFKDAYWDGASLCHPKLKMAWLSQQSWYLNVFDHDMDTIDFRTAEIFFNIRTDLQQRHSLDTDYGYKKYLYEIYLGDCTNEYFPDKFEVEWLNSQSTVDCDIKIGNARLPWVFYLIYEYEFVKFDWEDTYVLRELFPGYLFFSSLRWCDTAGLEVFYEWLIEFKEELLDSIRLYAKLIYQVELTKLEEIVTIYSKELHSERIDKRLLSLILDEPDKDISVLNDDISIQLHLYYLHQKKWGSSGCRSTVNHFKHVLNVGGQSLLRKLYYPLMQAYFEIIKISYHTLIRDKCSFMEGIPVESGSKNGTLTVVGYARSELGTGEDARRTHSMLASLGYDVSIYPLFPGASIYKNEQDELSVYESASLGNIQIFTMSPADFMLANLEKQEISSVRGYRIGYFAWEFPIWKEEFNLVYELLDEIWVISKFLLPAFENFKIPVKYIPPIVELTGERPSDDEILRTLGITRDKFIFLSIFDIKSTVTRKNPLALIDAFLEEYSGNKMVKLVLKFSYDETDKENNLELFELIENSENIIHISEMLCKSELEALISACDALVSLHRSEGFGRVIAEAMLLKTLVVCTNYSGNVDFCFAQNAILVDYDLITVGAEDYPFAAGLKWADVRKSSVIDCLRQAVDDADENRLKIENAYNYIKTHHSTNGVKAIANSEMEKILGRV